MNNFHTDPEGNVVYGDKVYAVFTNLWYTIPTTEGAHDPDAIKALKGAIWSLAGRSPSSEDVAREANRRLNEMRGEE